MYWLLFISLAILTCLTSQSRLSEELSQVKWLCVNKKCTEPISEARCVNNYLRDDPLKVNIKVGEKVFILGKPNGTNTKLWLVEVGNQKGVASKDFLKEKEVMKKKEELIETAFDFGTIIPLAEEKSSSSIKNIKPSPANTVIDGTTLSYESEEITGEIEDVEEVDESSEIDITGTTQPLPESPINENNSEEKSANKGIENFNHDSVSTSNALNNQNINAKEGNESNILESNVDVKHSVSQVIKQNDQSSGSDVKLAENSNAVENRSDGNIFTPQITKQSEQMSESSSEKLSVLKNSSETNTSNLGVAEKGGLDSSSVSDLKATVDQTEKSVLNSHPNQNEKEIVNPSVSVPANTFPTPQTVLQSVKTDSELLKTSSLENIENASSETTTEATKFLPEEKKVTLPGYLSDNAYLDSNVNALNNNPTPLDPEHKISSIDNIINHVFKTETVPLSPDPVPSFDSMSTPYSSQIGGDNSYQSGMSSSENNINLVPKTAGGQMSYNPEKPKVTDPSIDSPKINLQSPKTEEQSITDNDIKLQLPKTEEQSIIDTDIVAQESNDLGDDSNNIKREQNQDDTVRDTTPIPYFDKIGEAESAVEEGGNWFSGISAVMESINEMFSKSDIGVEEISVVESAPEPTADRSTVLQEQNDNKLFYEKKPDSFQSNDSPMPTVEVGIKGAAVISEMLEGFSGESQISWSTIWCLVITSVVILLFSLGHYYLENLKQEAALISKINTISAELFFAQKELSSIEEQYHQANENYQKLVLETSNNEQAIGEMRKELEESKASRKVLEDEIKRLEKEVESLIEEGDEMHRMLAESFSEEERTKSLLANISDLKGVLSERLKEIVSLTEQLDNEKQEVELLTISLKKSEEQREVTEDKLTKVMNDVDSKTLAVTEEYENKILMLERIIEERHLERTNFEKEICELQGTCESLSVEKELAEKALKKAHGVNSGKALSDWLDTKQIRTDFLTLQKEVEKLNRALEEAKRHGTLLEEKEKELLNEIESLNIKYESAEKDKIEALTKLQVLSNYFKEKEIQLQEELGTKEAQWLQKQSEDHTIYEQMRSLREENLSYKAQNEALKKEILDQETSFKIQIANEEQKAQENWLNLRHTERRLKEVQMEASHLRSRLTALETNSDSLEEKHKSLEMVNGDVSMGAASPPFMLYPPSDFIPPPPLVSPTRPPPLGRLSSPPLTPPAPLSPFEFYPPPPPSPPPPLRVHKPQPREPHRKQKDSQSSNHSSESLEKPVRRGKR